MSAPDMRLLLTNRPQNVALVRQAIGGLAGAVGLEDSLLADVKTAVSEACNNVVLHAYPDGEGALEVYACPDGTRLEVVVRDQGEGIQPSTPEPEATMHGVGLSLIQALTERVEFIGGVGEGTEVRMAFRADVSLRTEHVENENGQALPEGETVVSVTQSLAGPVLGSVIAVLAARAGFSIERLSDAQLITDAIAAHAAGPFAGHRVSAAIEAGDRRLDLHLGPLVAGGGNALVTASAVGGLEPVLERLTDELLVEPVDGGEQLRLTILDRR
ncbi:MAG: ATP-binding protein [Actinomycetota bacterium]|nr:ATP-binding protein [Actinomycetota bacterium]